MKSQDSLYTIFETYLFNGLVAEEHPSHLIEDVVNEYIQLLNQQGFIPHFVIQTIKDELIDEVKEMYQKKTYGFLTQKEFQTKYANKIHKKTKKSI